MVSVGGKRRRSFILRQAFRPCLYGHKRHIWVVAETKSAIFKSTEVLNILLLSIFIGVLWTF